MSCSQQIIRHVIYMSETTASIAIMQYKQSFYPISTCKLGFFSSLYCAFCYSLRRLLFYHRKKGEKRDVSNNKLFQILGRVYTSLHNRRFMSQARRTRHFVGSVRQGKEKNKAAVTSPLFWLLLCRLCLYLTEKWVQIIECHILLRVKAPKYIVIVFRLHLYN